MTIAIPAGATDVSFDVRGAGSIDRDFNFTPLQVTDGIFVTSVSSPFVMKTVSIARSSGFITIDAPYSPNGYSINLDNVRFTAPEPYFVRIAPHTEGSTPFTVERNAASASAAQLPLGAVFDIAIVKKQGDLLPVISLTSLYSERSEAPDLIPHDLPAAIRTQVEARTIPPLFQEETVLALGPGGPGTSASFIATHWVRYRCSSCRSWSVRQSSRWM
ncbi:MAG TPA: hypothetical protein VFN10_04455 [Thermoanaerobaculia bacterium]|nr:hypothetical protein [Thermoanaerobaculia bacterium]